MMGFFTFWFVCGFLALAIDIWSDYSKGKDIKVNDIPYMFIGVCLGIFTLLFVVCVHLKRTDAILIKGKTKYTPSEDSEEIKFTNHQPTYDRMQEINKRKAESSEKATLKSNSLED